MSYPLSRIMSAATAAYSGYALSDPGHLGRALGADAQEQSGYDLLAQTFGVRDLAISTFGALGRSDRTVRTAMWIRIACDLGDGFLLSGRAHDDETKAKVLAVTVSWGALNYLALRSDVKRARKAELAAQAATASVLGVRQP